MRGLNMIQVPHTVVDVNNFGLHMVVLQTRTHGQAFKINLWQGIHKKGVQNGVHKINA